MFEQLFGQRVRSVIQKPYKGEKVLRVGFHGRRLSHFSFGSSGGLNCNACHVCGSTSRRSGSSNFTCRCASMFYIGRHYRLKRSHHTTRGRSQLTRGSDQNNFVFSGSPGHIIGSPILTVFGNKTGNVTKLCQGI
ncbi:MAG: hypothetical protein BWY58_01544 [Chloroflexi bacterium ADurb.Bin344]|nr:MAG: hypothetical protein BWY58_01544 [Chloroflexi bacterium ADurb.Bin344]